MTGRTSMVIQPRSTPGQVLAISTASSMESASITEYPPSTSLVSMNGPSVTAPARIVLADAAPWSWWPPSSLPVAPHFSYQAPTSAYQEPYSALSADGSFGVSRISSTYFTRFPFLLSAPGGRPHLHHECAARRSDTARDFRARTFRGFSARHAARRPAVR